MRKYTLVVFTKPVAGKEREFNDWYSNRHLKDVVRIPGFISAQRYQIVGDAILGDHGFDFLALYELEADNPNAAIEELMRRAGTELMPMSDALDPQLSVRLFESISDKLQRLPNDTSPTE